MICLVRLSEFPLPAIRTIRSIRDGWSPGASIPRFDIFSLYIHSFEMLILFKGAMTDDIAGLILVCKGALPIVRIVCGGGSKSA